MKLSEAIRLGSMMKPQGFDQFYSDDDGSCAFGAACDAIGIDAEMDVWPAEWNLLLRPVNETDCPQCGEKHEFLVPMLNDDHRWSRERIADFVETIENQQEAPKEITQEVTV